MMTTDDDLEASQAPGRNHAAVQPRPASEALDKEAVLDVVITARRVIQVLASILVLFYGYLRFEGLPLGPTVDALPASVIVPFSLALYFASWVFGTTFDANEQSKLYTKPPRSRRFPREGYVLAGLLAAMFGIMCFLETGREFAIALMIFLVINVASWRYLAGILLPPLIESSKAHYAQNRDIWFLVRVRIFERYISGTWQWWRFAYGFLMAALLWCIAFLPQLQRFADSRLGVSSRESLLAATLLFYVVTFEGWIWMERWGLKFSTVTIGKLWAEYQEPESAPRLSS